VFVALRNTARAVHGRHLNNAFIAAALSGGLFTQGAMAADDSKSWAGIGWGLGIAADFDVGGERIGPSGASIVNGITRITDSSANVGVGFVLEAHYFFKDWPVPFVSGGCKNAAANTPPPLPFTCTDVATGPFVAVEVGGGTSATTNAGPITGYALGWMVGFHHRDSNKGPIDTSTSSWNLGIGLRIDPQAKVLGDGFVANLPPPAGETAVRLKTEPRLGIMLLSSFSF
jgi:hypothetical protein